MSELYAYDEETYPNIFTLSAERVSDGCKWVFEISDRRNDSLTLIAFIDALVNTEARMVGFNNINFDYPILHLLMQMKGEAKAVDLYNKAMSIIKGDDRFGHIIWDKDRIVPQIDLFKIHHFDNRVRSTSLKMLEFNMRSQNIQDLPFPPGTIITHEQMDELITYNQHDVSETLAFLKHTEDMIRFREELSIKYSRNFINHNDTKIGKDFFIMKLEEAGIPCRDENRELRQTPRPTIKLADAVFPYVTFMRPEFQRIHEWFKNQTIAETKGTFKDIDATLNGFKFVFGLGGIHGSVESQTIVSDETYIIRDADVTSYYPKLGIVNRVFPEHLSDTFCDIYNEVFEQRRQYAKDTAENAMFKLALNGVYGDSNNQYSPFYDPLYTMKITINGQLLLCMLAEHLMEIPGLQMIQINTDGLTVRMPRSVEPMYDAICEWWQAFTQLDLEFADYSRMFIRDVNNYIAEYTDGKIKRKGAYAHETPLENPTTREVLWNKNHSALVIPKAAEAALIHGQDIEDFIRNHDDLYDFMLRTKVPRSSKLVLVTTEAWIEDTDSPLQNITRYYVTHTGGSLVKVMPPTATQVAKALPNVAPDRRIGINVSWLVTECNDITDATVPINLEYYIQETKKLVEPLR